MKLQKKMGNKRLVCRYCFTKENLTIDHKKPKSKGGTDAKTNLQYLCKPCNTYKSNMSNRQFRNLIVNIDALLRRRVDNRPEKYKPNTSKI